MNKKINLRELTVKDGKIAAPETADFFSLYSVDALVKYHEQAMPSLDAKRDMVAREGILEDKFIITKYATIQKELWHNHTPIPSFDKFLALADDKGVFNKVNWNGVGFIEEGKIVNVNYNDYIDLTFDQFQQLGRPTELREKTGVIYEKSK